MTNVVITYTGNVCSTPMISYAGLREDVFVPVREQFDPHRIARLVPEPEGQIAILAETLAALYERQSAGLFDHPGFARFPRWDAMPPASEKPHLMFKWRPFLSDMPDSHRIAQLYARHEVSPVMLVRRSLAEHAIKVFMTEKVYGRSHQQFVAAGMKKDVYAAYMADQAAMQVKILPAEMAEERKRAQAFLLRTRLAARYSRHYFPHVATLPVIIAEDLFRPMLDRSRFDAVLAGLLGDTRPLGEQAEPDVRKAGLDISHCANLDAVLADPDLKAAEERYAELVGDLTPLRPFDA